MEEKLSDKLFNKKEIGWDKLNEEEKGNIFSFCDGYIDFLNNAKTEREAIAVAKKIAETNGYRDINTFERLVPGDKVYFINREKSMYLALLWRT